MSGRKIDEREETIGKLESLAGIEAKGVDWVWPQRIAAGSLTLLAGEAEVGKSTLALDLAARVSRGGNWPDGRPNGVAGGVLLVSAVNHREYTVAPILEAAGVDLDQIRMLSEVQVTRRSEEGEARIIGTRPLNLMKDLEVLAKMIEETPNCRLVVIDPITSFLGTGAKLQGVLLSLTELAARTRVAIVGITHLKGGKQQILERLACSMALTIAARAVWLLTRDPENPERRLFLPAKNNLTRQQTGLSLELAQDEGGKAPRVAWSSVAVAMTADSALEQVRRRPEKGDRSQGSGVNTKDSSEGASGMLLKGAELPDVQSRGKITGVLQEGNSGAVEEREEMKRRVGGDRGENQEEGGRSQTSASSTGSPPASSVQGKSGVNEEGKAPCMAKTDLRQVRQAHHRQAQAKECGPPTGSTGSLRAGPAEASSTGSPQADSGQRTRDLNGEMERTKVVSQNVMMGWKKRKKLKRRR